MDRLGQQPEKQPKQEILILTPAERLKALGWKALEALALGDLYRGSYQHLLDAPTEDELLERLYTSEDENNITKGEN